VIDTDRRATAATPTSPVSDHSATAASNSERCVATPRAVVFAAMTKYYACVRYFRV
jgi:hypothetical protein